MLTFSALIELISQKLRNKLKLFPILNTSSKEEVLSSSLRYKLFKLALWAEIFYLKHE